MKVLCVFDHGAAPSTRLRGRDCFPLWRQFGVEARALAIRSTFLDRRRLIREAARHDVVVLFKMIGLSKRQLARLQRANPKIIFDFDDAVMFREQKFGEPVRGKNFRKFLRTLQHCAAAVAGNDFLAAFARAAGVRSIVLPTALDLTKYQRKEFREGRARTIGWLGLSEGLPYLEHIQPALRKLCAQFPDLVLKIVSDRALQLEGVKIENEIWRADTEQKNLASFDIGIMPLWDSLWTRGKCGYKILQYMGVGTAVVASDVGANAQIIVHGENGFLARTQDDWVENLARLIEDAALRQKFGLRGRELTERFYSLENFAKAYATLFDELAGQP